MFSTVCHFHPNLHFEGYEHTISVHFLMRLHSGSILALSANIRLGWKIEIGKVGNTLAYYVIILVLNYRAPL